MVYVIAEKGNVRMFKVSFVVTRHMAVRIDRNGTVIIEKSYVCMLSSSRFSCTPAVS